MKLFRSVLHTVLRSGDADPALALVSASGLLPAAALLGLLVVTGAGCERAPVPETRSQTSEGPAVRDEPASAQGSSAAAPSGMLATPPPGHIPTATPRVPLPPNPEFASPGLDPETPRLAGITWEAPDPFEFRAPSSSMRAAEYVVAGAGADGPGLMTVFHFPGMGGSIEANVERWTGQFEGAAAQTETIQRDGLEITTVDVRGSFRSAMAQARPAPAGAEQRLLGAIVAGPEGPVFFKLLGPTATVTRAESAFEHFVGSLRPAPSS